MRSAKPNHLTHQFALLCATFSMLIAVSKPAAAMSLRELRALYVSSKQGENYVNYYLVGLMEGALEAHQFAVRQGAKPTMCPKTRIEPHLAPKLFAAEQERNVGVYEADMSAQLVMTNALIKAYPC